VERMVQDYLSLYRETNQEISLCEGGTVRRQAAA